MKKLVLGLLAAAVAFPAVADAQTRVRGYFRSDGTYVQPHYRSSPNSSRFDNYSTRGNVNPYTGEVGTKDPYGTYTPRYRAPSYGTYTTSPTRRRSSQSGYSNPYSDTYSDPYDSLDSGLYDPD